MAKIPTGYMDSILRTSEVLKQAKPHEPTNYQRYYADQPKSYDRIAREIGRLVTEKNDAYGDSFTQSGKIMAILYPQGITPEQYRDALAVVRIIDKLFRVANRKEAFGENPFRDIAGYGILGSADRG